MVICMTRATVALGGMSCEQQCNCSCLHSLLCSSTSAQVTSVAGEGSQLLGVRRLLARVRLPFLASVVVRPHRAD